MRYELIDSKLFIENRKKLAQRLQRHALALLASNDIMPTNADGTLGFRQNSDLFYLSGVDQPESMLLVFPDASDPEKRELLFLKETTELSRVWEGAGLSRKEAIQVSGISAVHWLTDFEKVARPLILEAETLYLNANEHTRADVTVQSREMRLARSLREAYPLHQYRRLGPVMHALRARKAPIELELIQKACDITEKGFRRVLKFIRPGVGEYEVEAEFIHEFLRHRSAGFAYGPIIATGEDNCILHYSKNNKTCRSGELLLMDVAADYANYASDMTRTVPVRGRFTRRQRSVYEAVLRVLRGASSLLKPGTMLKEYHQQVGRLVEQELLELGLLKAAQVKKQDEKAPLYKKYFMHGTSHFLGLDVHDVGLTYEPLEEDMVLTVEPAIYLPEEKFGIRLENDIVVRSTGNVDLMANIPIEEDEIEALMGKRSKAARK